MKLCMSATVSYDIMRNIYLFRKRVVPLIPGASTKILLGK